MIGDILFRQYGTALQLITEANPISKEHKLVLDEILKAHETNPEDVVSWDEVKKAAKKVL